MRLPNSLSKDSPWNFLASCSAIRLPTLGRRDSEWLKKVREILHDRYREPVALRNLAEEAGVHPVHLARAFRKQYGCCIGDFFAN